MLLISYGTRPEYIKLKSVFNELKEEIPFRSLYTGQHVDLVKTAHKADFELVITNDNTERQATIIKTVLNCSDKIFDGITHVMVQGDTTSAFAVALNAFYRGLSIIHLEAGGRTYDTQSPFPEEFNRQGIDSMASMHFCITKNDRNNLRYERKNGIIRVVGDTALDNLREIVPTYGNKILITLHRRENYELIPKWFKVFDDLAKKYDNFEFVLPIHPNPVVSKHRKLLKYVQVCDPMEHNDLMNFLADCKLVISDSGGIMHEACFLNKKMIVLRPKIETMKYQSLGIHFFLCSSPNKLNKMFERLIKHNEINELCPYGDGFTAIRIVKILKEVIK